MALVPMAELLGRETGTNRGRGGRGHIAQPTAGFFGAHAVVGGNLTIAAGVASWISVLLTMPIDMPFLRLARLTMVSTRGSSRLDGVRSA